MKQNAADVLQPNWSHDLCLLVIALALGIYRSHQKISEDRICLLHQSSVDH